MKLNNFIKLNNLKQCKFPLMPMGVLAPGSAHARPSAQPPIDVSGVGGGLKFWKVFLINFLAKSGNSKHFFYQNFYLF